jgi:hypothetical protein
VTEFGNGGQLGIKRCSEPPAHEPMRYPPFAVTRTRAGDNSRRTELPRSDIAIVQRRTGGRAREESPGRLHPLAAGASPSATRHVRSERAGDARRHRPRAFVDAASTETSRHRLVSYNAVECELLRRQAVGAAVTEFAWRIPPTIARRPGPRVSPLRHPGAGWPKALSYRVWCRRNAGCPRRRGAAAASYATRATRCRASCRRASAATTAAFTETGTSPLL